MITFNKTDINWQLAHDAHYGTSFSPEKRADGYVTGYMVDMQALVDEFSKFATDENRAALVADLESYRVKYLELLNKYLYSHSRVMSTMITGPANFPTHTNEKRSNWADAHRNRWLAHCREGLERLRKKYDPRRASQVIRSDDGDAIAKLEAKILGLEEDQEMMKAANKIINRKTGEVAGKINELVELGIDPTAVAKLFVPDFMGRVGFPSYQLQNNSANIRRLKERVEQLRREAQRQEVRGDQPREVMVLGQSCRVIENTNAQRLQLVFESKPPAPVREQLKRNGFRWSSTEGAWQRLLNETSRRVVENLAK